jgi:hypothetical protein
MVVPVFSFPFYQLASPDRGSPVFRLGALFDSGRWLGLKLPWNVPAGLVLVLILSVTAVICVLQELVPVLRHRPESRRPTRQWERPGADSPLVRITEGLSTVMPDVFVTEAEEFIIFSSTGAKPAVYLSTGLIGSLQEEELRAAVAHELAHIERGRRPFIIAAFALRMLMLFNPVALFGFRRNRPGGGKDRRRHGGMPDEKKRRSGRNAEKALF